MNDYEETFCQEVINDYGVDEAVLEIFSELIEDYGDYDDKANFIRRALNHSNVEYIESLVYAIDGDIAEFCTIMDIDWDSVSSIENSKDKWEDTVDFSGEFEDRLEELQEDED
jgi:hypothetical protein